MKIKVLTKDEVMTRLVNLEEIKDVHVVVYSALFEKYYVQSVSEASFKQITDPDALLIEFIKSGD